MRARLPFDFDFSLHHPFSDVKFSYWVVEFGEGAEHLPRDFRIEAGGIARGIRQSLPPL